MSSLLTDLAEKLHFLSENEATDLAFNYFNNSNQPYNDLFENLVFLSESHRNNINSINCLIQSFIQWKTQLNKAIPIPYFDENIINNLILRSFPIIFLKDFCEIFQISKGTLIFLLRSCLLTNPLTSQLYKRALNIIVKFNYQLDFSPNEILLPLILNTKDHLVHVYVDKNPQLEEYVLNLLNRLYQNGGKYLREILSNDFNIRNININKKSSRKISCSILEFVWK